MHGRRRMLGRPVWACVGVMAILLAGCAGMKESSSAGGRGNAVDVTLSGSQESPPVNTSGSGKGTITVGADRSVSGSVTTTGVQGTMAHIHQGAAGQNGPVIIPLTRTAAGTWTVPAGAKLTEAQFEAFKAGNLYVNVHTDANKGGEVRGQLKP
jgi:CHRD domain